MFIGLSTIVVNVSNHTKCLSLGNQQCMTQPNLVNLHPNECRLMLLSICG